MIDLLWQSVSDCTRRRFVEIRFFTAPSRFHSVLSPIWLSIRKNGDTGFSRVNLYVSFCFCSNELVIFLFLAFFCSLAFLLSTSPLQLYSLKKKRIVVFVETILMSIATGAAADKGTQQFLGTYHLSLLAISSVGAWLVARHMDVRNCQRLFNYLRKIS